MKTAFETAVNIMHSQGFIHGDLRPPIFLLLATRAVYWTLIGLEIKVRQDMPKYFRTATWHCEVSPEGMSGPQTTLNFKETKLALYSRA